MFVEGRERGGKEAESVRTLVVSNSLSVRGERRRKREESEH